MKFHKIFLGVIIFPTLLFAQRMEWVKKYNASGDYRDCGYGVAVDKAGYIYVTGQGYGKDTKCDFTTIKYAPNGQVVWMRKYNGSSNDYDRVYAITVDDSGYVYITGRDYGNESTFENIVTIKYDSEGNTMWTATYDGDAHDYDCPYAIVVDKNHNVYVTGESFGGEDTWEDIVTIKYDRNGNTMWIERYNGLDNDMDYPSSLVVDDNFNVYVTGLSYSLDTDEDIVTLKYAQPEELRKFQEHQKALAEAKKEAEEKAKSFWGRLFGGR